MPPLLSSRHYYCLLPEGSLPPEEMARALGVLSEGRRRKLEKLIRERDRINSLYAELGLRYLLHELCGIADPHLAEDSYGKPYLVGVEGLHFSLSHSGRFLYLGLSSEPIGVDVQDRSELPELTECRGLFLSEGEERILASLFPSGNFGQALHILWTMKESYLKRLGRGFALDPRKVDFSPISGFRDMLTPQVQDYTDRCFCEVSEGIAFSLSRLGDYFFSTASGRGLVVPLEELPLALLNEQLFQDAKS